MIGYNGDSHHNSSHPVLCNQRKANSNHSPGPTDDRLYNSVSHLNSSTSILYNQNIATFLDFETFKTSLKYHLNIAVQTYKCSKCEIQFATEDQLANHVIGHFLTTTIKHGCQYCLKLFSKPDELQKHLLEIHAIHLYWCSLCEEMFDSKVNIQVHFAVKHSRESTILKCTSCEAVFCSELDFQFHVRVAHSFRFRPFCCLLCNQGFPTEELLGHHLSTHKKQYSCKRCNKTFHVEHLLDKHVQSHHLADSLPSSEVAGDPVLSSCSSDLMANDRMTISSSDHDQIKNGMSSFAPLQISNEAINTGDHRKFCCDVCNETFFFKSQLISHHFHTHRIKTAGSQKMEQITISLFCSYCKKSFNSHSELETHVRIHAATRLIRSCDTCDEKFSSVAILAKHKLAHCKVVKEQICTTCKTNVHSKEEFTKHLKDHSGHSLPVPCIICQQTLESEEEVKLHINFHLNPADLRHSCCVCSREYVVHELIITARRENGHIYMCKQCFHAKGENLPPSECQLNCENTGTLEKHLLTHARRFRCVKCQSAFQREEKGVQVHVTTHLVQESTRHECKLCYRVLDSSAKLQCHLIEHSFNGSADYTCYVCNTVFSSPNDIQQHVQQHGSNSRIHHCSYCHQKFFFRAELNNHAFIHDSSAGSKRNHNKKQEATTTTTLKCSLCPQMFNTSADLQQHYIGSHGDRELEECRRFPDELFPRFGNLHGHIRNHAKEMKYTCAKRDKEFGLSRNLGIYIRSRSGERRYECSFCKRRFSRKENRRTHVKPHGGLKPSMWQNVST
ncbi:zinc finger protein 423-like [Limulus polyphemus]|uniref:Zinc finger protein 423-like n=1 Tax=Limulus polyphemus TaxID=6850 RepID=A0ABM1RW33_LIMPO|nr:zinc finger protein 423-like [Limulus polyphemus]